MFPALSAATMAGAALLVASAAATAQDTTAPPASACGAAQHRQFDFWVGEWIVTQTGKSEKVADSRIEALHGGCVVRERWMPVTGQGGSSLNHYDEAAERWHQTWIDSSNNRVVFEGGRAGDRMVLTGFWKNATGPGKHGLVRMTYSRSADGSVRQVGEISTNHGLDWSPFFDLTYRRKAGDGATDR